MENATSQKFLASLIIFYRLEISLEDSSSEALLIY